MKTFKIHTQTSHYQLLKWFNDFDPCQDETRKIPFYLSWCIYTMYITLHILNVYVHIALILIWYRLQYNLHVVDLQSQDTNVLKLDFVSDLGEIHNVNISFEIETTNIYAVKFSNEHFASAKLIYTFNNYIYFLIHKMKVSTNCRNNDLIQRYK